MLDGDSCVKLVFQGHVGSTIATTPLILDRLCFIEKWTENLRPIEILKLNDKINHVITTAIKRKPAGGDTRTRPGV